MWYWWVARGMKHSGQGAERLGGGAIGEGHRGEMTVGVRVHEAGAKLSGSG